MFESEPLCQPNNERKGDVEAMESEIKIEFEGFETIEVTEETSQGRKNVTRPMYVIRTTETNSQGDKRENTFVGLDKEQACRLMERKTADRTLGGSWLGKDGKIKLANTLRAFTDEQIAFEKNESKKQEQDKKQSSAGARFVE